MEIQSTTKSGFEKVKLDEDMYPATLKEIKDIPPGQYGDRVAVVFDVQAGNKTVELARICGKNITPASALGKILVALGATLEDGKMDVTKFYGESCRVFVSDYTDNDGEVRSGIDSVKPSKKPKEEKIE